MKTALRQSSSKKKVQSIPYIYPMNSDLLYDSSRNIPHVDLTRELHLSMCTHHAAAGGKQGGCRYVTTHGVAVSYEFMYATSRAQHCCALFTRRYKTLIVLDSLLLRSTHGGCRYVTTHSVDHVDVHAERGWRDGIGALLHLCCRAAG